jgi:hypothetical protein
MRISCIIIALALSLCLFPALITAAAAQSTGTPVNAAGQPSISGTPYVKTHKRHHRLMYGKHYNPNKFSK